MGRMAIHDPKMNVSALSVVGCGAVVKVLVCVLCVLYVLYVLCVVCVV